MSKIVVAWQLAEGADEAPVQLLIDRVKARYQPLFRETIEHGGSWGGNQGLLHFDIAQPTDRRVASVTGAVVCLTGSPTITTEESPPDGTLLDAQALYSRLVGPDGSVNRRALHEINPPFTLCTFDPHKRRLLVVHDGLGMDHFFVAATDASVVFSNRCWPILQLLNEPARIDIDAWRQWFCLGWNPANATPFRNIRYLERGEIVRADSRAIVFDGEDPIGDWISLARERGAAALMKQASESVRRIVRAHRPAAAPFGADLTGGRDSRAICAVLINERLPCTFYTGGHKRSADVALAKRIAARFHLDWHHVDDVEIAGRTDFAAALDVRFRKLLLWGEGFVEGNRFLHFGEDPFPMEYTPYLSGGQGEISKAYCDPRFARNYQNAPDFSTTPIPDERHIRKLLSEGDAARMTAGIRAHAAAGEAHGITGWPLLDFFHITHKLRRWQSSHLAINLCDRTVLPFVNVQHIQLAFALPPPDKVNRIFQHFVIEQNVPELLRIPFAHTYRARLLAKLSKPAPPAWASYLRGDGRNLIEELFSPHALLWGILDRDRTRAVWRDFLRGSNENALLVLGLLAFRHWHAIYVDEARVDRLEFVDHRVG